VNAERLLTPTETAERLGISPLTVAHMLRAGRLPGVKVGRLWRIREADLDEYVRALAAAYEGERRKRATPQRATPQRATPQRAAKARAQAASEGGDAP
jgi:excisionase family DNA binding protein